MAQAKARLQMFAEFTRQRTNHDDRTDRARHMGVSDNAKMMKIGNLAAEPSTHIQSFIIYRDFCTPLYVVFYRGDVSTVMRDSPTMVSGPCRGDTLYWNDFKSY